MFASFFILATFSIRKGYCGPHIMSSMSACGPWAACLTLLLYRMNIISVKDMLYISLLLNIWLSFLMQSCSIYILPLRSSVKLVCCGYSVLPVSSFCGSLVT